MVKKLLLFGSLFTSFISPINNLIKENIYSKDISSIILSKYNKELGISDEKTIIMSDLNNNNFILKFNDDSGYVIFDEISNQIIEYSQKNRFNYKFKSFSEYLYLGPTQIYEKKESSFKNIYSSEYIDFQSLLELQDTFNTQLNSIRKTKFNSFNYHNYTKQLNENITYIHNYEYIKDHSFPENKDGSCGFVAASMLMYYWSKTVNSSFVPKEYLNSYGQLISLGYTLKNKLVELNNNNPGSWGLTVKNTLDKFADLYNFNFNTNWYLGNINLKYELENNRPVIIFGNLPENPPKPTIEKKSFITRGKAAHAVVAYGYQGNNPIVHYGWQGFNEVVLNSGIIGSVTTMNPIPNYKTTITIKPKDLNFDLRYYNYEITENHNINGIEFTTNRLRTGFIEFEKTTLSSRTAGQKEAYLRFKFKNPINKISMYMSYWSKNEKFVYADKPQANIYARTLFEYNQYEVANLFGINLPTDRQNQTRYDFEFPKSTKEVFIWVRNEYLTGLLDRNKGRIAIGDIIVEGYKS